MNAPARWAWERMLKAFEETYNVLIADPSLQVHEREGLYSVHAALRRRASVANDV